MTLDIRQVGEPVLRQRARPLTADEIRSTQIQRLIGQMQEAMRQAPGVGLAAPQIGFPLQLAVIEDREEYLEGIEPTSLAERERQVVPFHVIINPHLSLVEAPPVVFFEGCLSVDGFGALVPRARAVRVECLNERGEPIVIQASGWYARILQHEIDHLYGTLYVDRMISRSFMTLDNLSRYWSDKTVEQLVTALDLSAGTVSQP
jgi:peptide deformylase